MKTEKPDIKKLDFQDYLQIAEACGEKSFRAKQLSEWLWKKNAVSFEEMSNLSSVFREFLENNYFIGKLEIIAEKQSKDKTIKVAFRLDDNAVVEGVLIPAKDRVTACISSQVGCALACTFCATGDMGFVRNLLMSEIYDQLVLLNLLAIKHFKRKITNVVLMGMGEPLLNYDEVKKAITLMTSKEGLAMSPSRITLSTVGIIDGIKKMADDEVKYNLAVSLHIADNEKRSSFVPANKKNDLNSLKDAIRYFYEKTSTRITYEYLLLDGFNDSVEDAAKLAEFCKICPCKINLIEYNAIKGSKYKSAGKNRRAEFVAFLESKNLIVNIRRSMGSDIDAACGQLAIKVKH